MMISQHAYLVHTQAPFKLTSFHFKQEGDWNNGDREASKKKGTAKELKIPSKLKSLDPQDAVVV